MNLLECKKEEIVTPDGSPQRRTPIGSRKRNAPLPLLPEKTSVPSTPQKVFVGESEPLTMEEKQRWLAEFEKKRSAQLYNLNRKKQAEMDERELQRKNALKTPATPRKKRTTVHNKNVVQMTEMSEDPAIYRRQCDTCFAVFDCIPKLKRHVQTHGDRVDAICNLCAAPLKYSYNMKSHFGKCFQQSVVEKEDLLVRQNFPDYLRRLDMYAKGKLIERPALPEGLTMDRNGIVSGRPTTIIRADFSKIIPGYGIAAHDKMGYQFASYSDEEWREESK